MGNSLEVKPSPVASSSATSTAKTPAKPVTTETPEKTTAIEPTARDNYKSEKPTETKVKSLKPESTSPPQPKAETKPTPPLATPETSSSQTETKQISPPKEENWTQKTLNYAGGIAKGFGNEALKTAEGIRQAVDTAGKAIPTHALAKGLADASLGKGTQGFADGWNETQKAWSDIGNGAGNLAKTAWNVSAPGQIVNGLNEFDQINKLPTNLTPEQRQAELKRIRQNNPSRQAIEGLADGLTGIPSAIESGGDPEKVGEAVFKIGSNLPLPVIGKAKAATEVGEAAIKASQVADSVVDVSKASQVADDVVDAAKAVSKEIPTPANNAVPFTRKAPDDIPANNIVPFTPPANTAAASTVKSPKNPNNGEAIAVAVAEKPSPEISLKSKQDLQSTKETLEGNSPSRRDFTNKKEDHAPKGGNGNTGNSTTGSGTGTLTVDRSSSSGNGSSGGNSSSVGGGGKGNNNSGKVNGSSGNGNSGSSGKSTALTPNQEEFIKSAKNPEELRELLEAGEIPLGDFQAISQNPDIQKLTATDKSLQEQMKVHYGNGKADKLINDAKSREALQKQKETSQSAQSKQPKTIEERLQDLLQRPTIQGGKTISTQFPDEWNQSLKQRFESTSIPHKADDGYGNASGAVTAEYKLSDYSLTERKVTLYDNSVRKNPHDSTKHELKVYETGEAIVEGKKRKVEIHYIISPYTGQAYGIKLKHLPQ